MHCCAGRFVTSEAAAIELLANPEFVNSGARYMVPELNKPESQAFGLFVVVRNLLPALKASIQR